ADVDVAQVVFVFRAISLAHREDGVEVEIGERAWEIDALSRKRWPPIAQVPIRLRVFARPPERICASDYRPPSGVSRDVGGRFDHGFGKAGRTRFAIIPEDEQPCGARAARKRLGG